MEMFTSPGTNVAQTECTLLSTSRDLNSVNWPMDTTKPKAHDTYIWEMNTRPCRRRQWLCLCRSLEMENHHRGERGFATRGRATWVNGGFVTRGSANYFGKREMCSQWEILIVVFIFNFNFKLTEFYCHFNFLFLVFHTFLYFFLCLSICLYIFVSLICLHQEYIFLSRIY